MGISIPILSEILGLVREVVPDKDKQNELTNKLLMAEKEFDRTLLTTSTTPKADAFVKVLFAIERFIGSLWRPLGGAALTAFGMYCHWKGISLPDMAHVAADAAFPTWGAAREVQKRRERRRKFPPLPDIEVN